MDLQQALGVWPDKTPYLEYHRYIKWHWLYMELGTLVVGVCVAWKYKYPFLILPIAVTLWYLTMDITAMISGGDINWELRRLVSMYTGLLMIGLAFWVDIRARNTADYAFWLYIFGVMSFWCGLTFQDSDSEISKFMYFCVNVFYDRRRGSVGSPRFRDIWRCWLVHLSGDILPKTYLRTAGFFPMALTVIGLSVVYLGVLWQKNQRVLTTKARSFLPSAFRELLGSRT